MKKVLILCTGNSCRSIMAEALINHYHSDKYLAFSAGVRHSSVHPTSVQVLQEMGIATEGLYSKGVTEFLYMEDLDLVITVCDNARQTCPSFPKAVKQIHIGIEDPVLGYGASAEAKLESFRNCRDTISATIVNQLDTFF